MQWNLICLNMTLVLQVMHQTCLKVNDNTQAARSVTGHPLSRGAESVEQVIEMMKSQTFSETL